MKKLSVLFAAILCAAYSVASADSGRLEPGSGVIIYDSDNLVEYWYSPAALATHSEGGDLQTITKTGLSAAPFPSNPLWDVNDHFFLADSSAVSQLVRSAARIEPLQMEYAKGGLPTASDMVNPGFGPFFISGTIDRNTNSLPESSTMLILGLGLIGLAGYGGRKKFKH